jgi:Eco57I restriction-modification methylase
MAASDALIVGEDWISEHYFTTDAKSESFQAKVAGRRKAWDEDAKIVREDGDPESKVDTARSRFLAARGSLSVDLASLLADAPDVADAKLPDLYARLRTIFGYNTGEYTLKQVGPVIRVTTPDLNEAAPLVIAEARAADTVEDLIAKDGRTLLTPYEADETTTYTSVARLLSALFVADDGPEFALVLAGRWLLVTERARWAEGRYLAVNLQLVCDRNNTKSGGEIDRALACVSAESLAPDAEGGIWWHGVLEDSVKHTVGVSQDLREGVRLSIEIIANEVVQRRKAHGLDPLPQEQAQPLARQALRYLYRILFLLYAEASPELEVLPVGAEEYDQGYGLDRLRELTLVELTGPRAIEGTHLYDSLGRLFSLVDQGHQPPEAGEGEQEGLVFNSLRADLFLPKATELIDKTGLGNAALQRVLRHLLLSKEARGKDRGFISYAELGINQLGAVYEGLMSYTGFFAEEDLYEVAKGGDPSKGSWVVPVDRADDISQDDFVRLEDEVTGEKKAVIHRRGTFVFRLAGRERQQSASYYTPEVLTRFTVSQALEELLDQDGHTTTAEEILGLTVCEPALGSGAFAIEAVRQLAGEYLRRRQRELRTQIDPEKYAAELQRVKASIALHQVYGVDLNATAVELAEISLWLDTMVSGLQAPWFGLRLRRGNSLIGARRAVYTRAQVNDKSWLKATPIDVPMTGMVEEMANETIAKQTDGRIHHFLLPASGWGSAVEAKEAVSLAPEKAAALKKWRSAITGKPTAKQLNALVELAHRVEALWQLTLRRLQIAEAEARRDIPLWGRDDPEHAQAVTREEIENTLSKRNGAYKRLRRVMDVWAALWFWPLTDTHGAVPPTLDQWIDACQQLLGREPEARKNSKGMTTLGAATNWEDLNDAEDLNLDFAGAVNVEEVLKNHPWLKVCDTVAEQQGFFHWELDFATVFTRGGFDLQLGNPPWVRPRTDVDALMAEGDPWWQLALKPSETARQHMRQETLALDGMLDLVIDGTTDIVVTAEYLGSQEYPLLAGLQPDLYRCFMEQTWEHMSRIGVVSLIHPESHFSDDNAALFREYTYLRLRRYWQFINEHYSKPHVIEKKKSPRAASNASS